MAIMTIDQALASPTATGITIVDTPTNIARGTLTASLLPRVTAFNMNANGATSPGDAKLLAGLGTLFSKNSFTLTVRGSVADLTNPLNAAGLTLATTTAVFDTAANILAAAALPVITGAGSIVMSSSADVSLAGMIAFTTMPSFSVNPGAIITLADTAANLLAITNGQKRGALQAYKVAVDSTVDVDTALDVVALQNFSVGSNATLTVSDTLAALTAQGVVSQLPTLANITRVVVRVTESVTALLEGASSITTLAVSVPALRTQATDSATVTAAELAVLADMPNFSMAAGQEITVQDTATNLLAVSAGDAQFAQNATLSAPATLTTQQVVLLASRFGLDIETGSNLTISDTLAALTALASDLTALATAIILEDTAAHLIAATQIPFGVTAIRLLADNGTYTIAHIEALAALVPEQVTMTVVGSEDHPALRISDTLVNLVAARVMLAELSEAGPVAVTPTDNGGTVSADSAATLAGTPDFNPALFALSVSDTGAALSAVADEVFGRGFLAITVASGVFDATAAQLLDDTLAFEEGATARLGLDATLSAAEALALSALPGFALAQGVDLIVSDQAADLADQANAAGLSVATAVVLADDALIDAQQAGRLAALGPVFDTQDHAIAVAGTLSDLLTLAGSSALQVVNGWTGPVMLSAPVTASAADAATLARFTHFESGPVSLTIQDTAAELLHMSEGATEPDAWAVMMVADQVALSADAVVTSEEAAMLAGLGARFGNGGHDLVVLDTPDALSVTRAWTALAGEITGFELADQAQPWVISASQAAALAMLPNLDVGPGLSVVDTVAALLAPGAGAGLALAGAVSLSGDSTVIASVATSLHAIAHFSAGTHDLIISDGAARLATLDQGTAAMATAIQLAGNSLITAAQFEAVRDLPNFSLNSRMLIVSDTAENLLALDGDTSLIGITLLQGTASLTAEQATALTELPSFNGRADRIAVVDTAEAMLFRTNSQDDPDNWEGLLLAGTVTLSADAIVTAADASDLAALGSRFSAGTHTLTLRDSASELLDAANARALEIADVISLSSGPVTITAAQAMRLVAIDDFTKGSAVVTISDTADALTFAGFDAGLALADHIQLSTATTLSVADAAALVGTSTFQVNANAALTISDTLVNLLELASTTLPSNNTLLHATPISLSEDSVATVAQLLALRSLPQYALNGAPFDLDGNDLVLRDTGRRIANFTADAHSAPTAYEMTGDATLTAADATILAGRSVDLGDNLVTISDSAIELLAPANSAGLAIADMLVLSGNAVVTADVVTALFADDRFWTGGRMLTVQDDVEALLDLSGEALLMSTVLQLVDSETIDAVELRGLARLGVKFDLDDNTLTVVDTATNLADLGTLELELATHQTLGTNATVSAAMAEELADLPDLALGDSVTLTIQDSVENLIELSQAARDLSTAQRLPTSASVVLTAAEAADLAALPAFTNAGATIIVRDTIANLAATETADWTDVATSYEVVDSIGNIAANGSNSLLVQAASVTPSGDSTIDAATAAILADTPDFDAGDMLLVVVDGPAAMAANVDAILAVATGARINQSSDVSVTQADALVPLDTASLLTFASGHQLNVVDTFAHLSDEDNAEGLALADHVTILDTASALEDAAEHDWGSLAPDYELSANATVTASVAVVFAGLGAHFSAGDQDLEVSDTAGAIAGAASALNTLGVPVHVVDAAQAIGTQSTGLLTVTDLASVTLTDSGALSAANAAGLHELADLLTGDPLEVADDAADVAANITNLLALGNNLGAVQVTDNAAAIGAVAGGQNPIQTLGGRLSITLTDSVPVTAEVAADLLPVLANIAGNTQLNVTDTAAALVAVASDLVDLGDLLGVVSISGGTNLTAAIAVGLLPIEDHMGLNVQVSVTDSAAAIVAESSGLTTLLGESRISAITAPDSTSQQIVTNGGVLDSLGAHATILDSAANVNARLDSLVAFAGSGGVITAIVLSDGGTPTVTVSLSQLHSAVDVLGLIGSNFALHVSDTAANIEADLANGQSSYILGVLQFINQVIVSDAGDIELTVAQIEAAGVNDGDGSALDIMTGGTVTVTGATVDDVADLAAMGVVPDSILVSDVASAISADLATVGSHLVTHRALIEAIAVSDNGTVSLTASRATASHVDDGAGSVMSKVTGGTFAVTAVAEANIDAILALAVAPDSIAIVDTAANLEANLIGSGSSVRANLEVISGITVSPAGTITLSAAQALTAGFNDGSGSALGKMTGVTLAVIDASVDQIDDLMALGVAPTSIGVVDTAAHVQADLIAGNASLILAHLAALEEITVTPSGTVTLTAAQALATDVDDALALTTGVTLVVTGATVAELDALMTLVPAPSDISVTDTAAHIIADIAAGNASDLVAHRGPLSSLTVSDSDPITLTQSQVLAANVNDGAGSALSHLTNGTIVVTGVDVAHIDAIAALPVAADSFSVSDTAANLATDLALGASSDLLDNLADITAITNSDAGAVSLTAAQVLFAGVNDGAGSALSKVTGGSLVVTAVAVADIDTIAALPVAPASITVTATAATIQADLAVAGTSNILEHLALISGVTNSDAGTVTLTAEQVVAAGVNDGAGSALSKVTGGSLVVTGVAVADIPAMLALGVAPASITVSDTAAHIEADFQAGAGSLILGNLGDITQITVSDNGTIAMTLAEWQFADINDGAGSAASLLSGGTLVVMDATVADVASAAALPVTPDEIAVEDTAAHIQADLALGGSSSLLVNRALLSGVENTDAGVITLTSAQVTVAHVNDGAGSVMSLVTGGTLVVTGVAVADIETILALPVAPASITVSDTAAAIAVDLGLGGSSDLLSNIADITAITNSNSATILLTSAQVRVAGVNDGAGSVLSKVTGGDLVVTGVAIADIDTILALPVAPTSIKVSDTAASIATDLALGGSSELLSNNTDITEITNGNAGAITLTSAQVLVAGVNDGAGSVLSKVTGGSLIVTGVAVADIDTILGLGVAPASITISDTAANIQADLALGGSSDILGNLADITNVVVSDAGIVSLTLAQMQAAGVNDGAGSAAALLSGGTLRVTGIAVADIDTVLAFPEVPDSATVSDTAANIATDLALGGSSDLLANAAMIVAITNSNAGAITATSAQVQAAGVNDGAGSVLSKVTGGSLVVTGVAVTDIDTILGLPVAPASMTISDTAAHIATDLALGGSSVLLANLADITAITNSDAGAITLTSAQVLVAGVNDGVGSVMAKVTGGSLVVTGVAVADIDTILALGVAPASLTISDTAANIQADLALGGSSDILANLADITSVVVSDAGVVALTLAQMQAVGLNDGAGSAAALLSGGTLRVTGITVAEIDTVLAFPEVPDSATVSDTAANIATDLALGGSSDLLANNAMLFAITNSNAGAITLTSAQVQAAGVNDGAGSVLSKVTGGSLVVTGVTVADVETILGLGVVPASITVGDTAANIATDLALGLSSDLLTNLADITTITNSNAGAITLTSTQVLVAGVNDGAGSVMAKVTGGSLIVTGVAVADIDTILALDVSPASITISDTAANIQADLALGGSSDVLAALGTITGLAVSDAGVVALTLAQMQAAGVNDGAGSAAALLSGGTLRVTSITVAEIDTVLAFPEVPDSATVSDTAANIATDLALGGSSDLLANNAMLFAITNSNAGAITLTSAQVQAAGVNDGAGSVLAKVTGGSVVVTGVTVADVETILGLGVAPASITVSDTAANIATDLALGLSSDLLTNLADITTITNSNAGAITLTSAQVLVAGVNDGAGSVMAKVTGGSLIVTGVAVADIDTILALDVSPASITISDTAANIQADLALGGSSDILAALGTITSVVVSDAGVVALTLAQMQAAGVNDGAGSAAALLSGGTLRVTSITVAEIDTVLAFPEIPDSATVSDTAANISTDLALGGSSDLLANNAMLFAISNSNAGAITLTSAQVQAAGVNDGAGSVLSKVTGGTLVVTGVTVADVETILGLGVAPASITVSDTAAHIQADLALGGSSDLLANNGDITAITNSNAGAITLTSAQVLAAGVNDGAGSVMAKVTGGSLIVTGVAVADIDTILGLGVAPASISISDTAAHIQADLALGGSSDLLANLGDITAITVSPAGTITLTVAQVLAQDVNDGNGSAFDLMTGATLGVSNAAIADLVTLFALDVTPAEVTILDSTANILGDFGGAGDLGVHAAAVTSVKATEGSMTVADATTIFNSLVGIATFDESALTITGTAAALLTAQGAVPAMLTAALAVTMSNNPTGLTAAEATTLSGILDATLGGGQTMDVADTIANLLDQANAAGIDLATTVELSGATSTTAALATELVAIEDFNVAAQAITIVDTVANILDNANAAGIAAATTVNPSANITVTAAQLTALDAIAAFAAGGHTITVQDTVANILALSQGNLSLADTVRVADSSANVGADLNSLKTTITDNAHTLVIALSDGVANTPTITTTAVTYSSVAAVIDAITTTGAVRVIGTAAQIAALAATLAADTTVSEVYVTDTAANILSNLTTLNTIGSKFVVATLTDNVINASEIAGLLEIANLEASSLTVSDNGAQIAAAIAAADSDGLAFINSLDIELSEDSVITAADALALQGLTNLDKNGHTLKVWDSAANLIDTIDGYLAAVNDPSIDAVHLKTTGGSATVSPATAATLLSITNFSKDNPNASTNTLIVSGSAANIEANYATLDANDSLISSVVLSSSGTVTDAVYAHLLNLGATAGGGVSLTVRDTAATLAANAPGYLGGSPSITPTTWALSASASVTAANAAILGGLAGFSAGNFTLTLSAAASGVSVADANKIGALGNAFDLDGHTLQLAGDVATVSGLSNDARLVVTPDITDTFANISTLTNNSNLLGGTITVTDSSTVTVNQAAAFLDLLKVGNDPGILAASVFFGNNIAAVTDTFTNVQTLTGSGGWTANSSVHDDFNLVVADSVSTLVNGSNTASLSSMNATTFSSNQSTTAANATSLFTLKDTIHFDRGAYTLTISDTPTNLLDSSYDNGKTFADTWQLTANATVAAVDAEALLAEAKFVLNHTLTVSDTSDSLLDGVLSPLINASAYKASIQVELSGAETLNARTAARLVALSGFTDTDDLSIQDGASYLLNPANLTALTFANTVTLAGDETASALTTYRLSVLPNFTLGANTIYLASNDYANAATLTAIADFDDGFDDNGKTITLTQSALALTPTQYAALADETIVLNGHAVSALATGVTVGSTAGTVHVTGNGVDGATLKVYASDGTVLTTVNGADDEFDVTADVNDIINGVVVTTIVGGVAASGESAPIIGLERTVLTDEATSASATFAADGDIQVDTGQYIDLYTTTTAPDDHANPILVYDPSGHTLSMRIDDHGSLTLLTLGTATHPLTLDPSEIYIRHFT